MGPYGTNYTETEALLAVQSDDEQGARDIIDEMLPGERRRLAEAASRLATLCVLYCQQCGAKVDSFSDLVTLGVVGKDAPMICKEDADTYQREQQARRATVRARRDLVHAAVAVVDSYARLAEVTGIPSSRIAEIRDGETEPVVEELARLALVTTAPERYTP